MGEACVERIANGLVLTIGGIEVSTVKLQL